MSKLVLVVVADENDADYQTAANEITEDQLELVKPIIEAIKNFKPYKVKASNSQFEHEWTHDHNWPNGDPESEMGGPRTDLGEKTLEQIYDGVLTAEQINWFNEEFVPWTEYGVHTIKSITLQKIEEETNLYKHKYYLDSTQKRKGWQNASLLFCPWGRVRRSKKRTDRHYCRWLERRLLLRQL